MFPTIEKVVAVGSIPASTDGIVHNCGGITALMHTQLTGIKKTIPNDDDDATQQKKEQKGRRNFPVGLVIKSSLHDVKCNKINK